MAIAIIQERDASYLDQQDKGGGEVRWRLDVFEDGTEM